MTVSDDPVNDEIVIQKFEMKENTAYGNDHLATVSSKLGEHEEVCEIEETTPDYQDGYEDVSQV